MRVCDAVSSHVAHRSPRVPLLALHMQWLDPLPAICFAWTGVLLSMGSLRAHLGSIKQEWRDLERADRSAKARAIAIAICVVHAARWEGRVGGRVVWLNSAF